MFKRITILIATALLYSHSKADYYSLQCLSHSESTQVCFPKLILSEEKYSNHYNYEVVFSSDLEPLPKHPNNNKIQLVIPTPLILEDGLLVLPHNEYFDLKASKEKDPESILEDIINNPGVWIKDNPILEAAWTELDGDVKK